MKKPWKKVKDSSRKKEKIKQSVHEKPDEEENSKSKEASYSGTVRGRFSFLIDIGIALGLIVLIFVGMYIYTGNWPPMVVVESSSMAHGYGSPPESSVGVIDTGDLVWVKKIAGRSDVVTYIEGKKKGHETYGDYGDVIIYLKNGIEDTPVIHRAVAWIEYNNTFTIDDGDGQPDIIHTFDILSYDSGPCYNVTQFTLYNYGWQNLNITFDLLGLDFSASGKKPHSGFITLGDHNGIQYDQRGLADARGFRVEPVRPEWIVGKARGEIPWMGIIRLYFMGISGFPSNSVRNMFITLGIIIAIPIVIEIGTRIYARQKEKRTSEDEGENGVHERDKKNENDGKKSTEKQQKKTAEERLPISSSYRKD